MWGQFHWNYAEGQRGFTLIELIVVVGIVGLLAGLVFSSVSLVRETGRRTRCAANLGMMAKATLLYADEHGGRFPWASRRVGGEFICWDFITDAQGVVRPGEMWNGMGISSVLQCPSFAGGEANWQNNPYTGYNYNSSYIGKVEGDPGKRRLPARLAEVEQPARTALFGDGEYSSGANKFMRAPRVDRQADANGKSVRLAGTQGFRHRGKTNVAFCDGHVEALVQPYQTDGKKGYTTGICGFLSEDNRLYSLKKTP